MFNEASNKKKSRWNPANWSIFTRAIPVISTSVINSHATSYSVAYDTRKYINEGFKENNVVYACIRRIYEAAKNLKLDLYRNGELIEWDSMNELERRLVMLLKYPSSYNSYETFIEQYVIYMNVAGIAYLMLTNADRVDTDFNSDIFELHLPHPKDIVVHASEFILNYFEHTPSKQRFDQTGMAFVRMVDPDNNFQGMPPMRAAASVIDSYNQSVAWNWKTLKSGGVLQTIIGLKTMMNVKWEDAKRLIAEWNERTSEQRGKREPMIIPAESMDVHQLTANAQEIDWLNGQKELFRSIARVFGVDSKLLGDPDASTYNNVAEAQRALYRDTVLPMLELFTGVLNRWLTPKFGAGLELRLNTSGIDVLQENENDLTARLSQASWKTINEKLAEDGGLPEVEGGDIVLVSQGVIPLELIRDEFSDDNENGDKSDV